MTSGRVLAIIAGAIVSVGLGGCGKDDVRASCDETQPYQLVVPGQRIVVPEGLDPLDEYKEMPIPEVAGTVARDDNKCLEAPPSVQ